jgi:protein phosphatase
VTTLRAGSATHVGQVRSNNQDTALVIETNNLYGVADGMGGHQGGEVASAMAVALATEHTGERTLEALKQAARVANRAIFEKAGSDPELHGMGTTLVAVQLVDGPEGDEIAWINVGDSRVYLLRDDELRQLSHDHSLVEDLVRDGRITRDEAKVHPQRNILTRALGIDLDVNVDGASLLPLAGDRYLLCSDGLFNEVSVDQMSAVLRRLVDPDEAAAELVRLANEGGGRDNITVVVVDVIDDDGRAAAIADAQAAAVAAAEARAAAERAAVEEAARQAALAEQEGDLEPAAALADRRSSLPEAHDDYAADTDDLYADLHRVSAKRVTWRVLAFVVALLIVAGVVLGAMYVSQSGTYHARVRGDVVSVYRGSEGGFLGIIDPTFEYDMRLSVDDIPEQWRSDVLNGKEFSSVAAAREWEFNVQQAIAATSTTTTTTTTTTTRPTTTRPTTTSSSTTPTTAANPAPGAPTTQPPP